MDDYPYDTLGADDWLRCDGLHHPGFLTLLRDVLRHFGHTGTPVYHGARTVSSDVDAVRSMWTSRLTPPTRA
jgi:hypothetical protein